MVEMAVTPRDAARSVIAYLGDEAKPGDHVEVMMRGKFDGRDTFIATVQPENYSESDPSTSYMDSAFLVDGETGQVIEDVNPLTNMDRITDMRPLDRSTWA